MTGDDARGEKVARRGGGSSRAWALRAPPADPMDVRRPIRRGKTVAEDRKEPPFDGGSQPVPHQKDPVPGPGRSAAQWVTIILCVLVIAAILVYIFGR